MQAKLEVTPSGENVRSVISIYSIANSSVMKRDSRVRDGPAELRTNNQRMRFYEHSELMESGDLQIFA